MSWSKPEMRQSIYIGYDPREIDAYIVARETAKRNARPIPVHGLILQDLTTLGLYKRPIERLDGRLFDVISGKAMSTEFALTRFLVPHLAGAGWALFMDCDMMIRGNLSGLFNRVSRMTDKAVVCVKHDHRPSSSLKMDGQVQSGYPRKNWSSFMFFNCGHPSNQKLTLDLVNTAKGLDLHQFCWLEDHEIGEIGEEWNCLIGYTNPGHAEVMNAHFTEGIPSMPGHENDLFADEWRAELLKWAR